jgi:glycerophosphoryl diester phosphodiesterase
MLHWPQTKPDFISYNINDLPSWPVSLFENLMSVPAICWTVRTPEQAQKAAQICDQITFEGFDPGQTP